MFGKMWLLLYVGILLANQAWASTTSTPNDIIPDQPLQIPYGKFCFFTMSELMFRDRMQQVAPSAYRVGAGRLVDMHLISMTSYSYESLWGAYYYIEREDYSKIIQYARSRDTVGFVSTMEIESLENETGLCILTDVALQPGTYPCTQNCSTCYGSGGSNNQPSPADYQQELASMGVPASYFQTMGNLPTMQAQGSSPSGSPGASASGQIPQLGASAQGNLSPTSLGASAQTPLLGASAQGNLSPTPSLGASVATPTPLSASAQGNLSPTSVGASAQTPLLGASAQGNLSPTSVGASAQTPLLGGSAQGNLQPPTGSFGAGSPGGVYLPRTNFGAGIVSSGNPQQSSLVPGFTFASASGQYSFLSAQGGGSFMN